MIWFEKTVEYKYVIRNHLHYRILPFAGPIEKLIGDAITQRNGEFRILEFKRSAHSRPSEWQKYPKAVNDRTAREKLLSEAANFESRFGKYNFGHYIIFGAAPKRYRIYSRIEKRYYPQFQLNVSKYWDFGKPYTGRSVRPGSFKDVVKLREYIGFLAINRVESGASSGSEEMVEAKRGKSVAYLTLSEFQTSLDLALNRANVLGTDLTTGTTPRREADEVARRDGAAGVDPGAVAPTRSKTSSP